MRKVWMLIFFAGLITVSAAQPIVYIDGAIDFGKPLRQWDGFGVNYVQTAHTIDNKSFPQDYGGFSILSESKKAEIIDLIFGADGLKPGIVKMFLDPLHQSKRGGAYDHKATTSYMLDFVTRGLQESKKRNCDLQILTTLYAPPAYMTKQKEYRGRDFDPVCRTDLENYLLDWCLFLKKEKIPVKYLSLHNEGEDWRRWPLTGESAEFEKGHDYNMYWPPSLVASLLETMPVRLRDNGLSEVGLTPGETSRFYQFYHCGYYRSIVENKKALDNLALFTSHNFYNGELGHRWFSGSGNIGLDRLRSLRPDLHGWVTSASWGKMDINFILQIYMNIYMSGINGYIPWAVIQRPAHWVGGDPNPGTAIRVEEDGSYSVLDGYYWYKQVSRAGQPGMSVAYTECMDAEISLMAFGASESDNSDNFIVINSGITVPAREDAVILELNDRKFLMCTKYPSATPTPIDYTCDISESGYRLNAFIPESLYSSDDTINMKLSIIDGEYAIKEQVDTAFQLNAEDFKASGIRNAKIENKKRNRETGVLQAEVSLIPTNGGMMMALDILDTSCNPVRPLRLKIAGTDVSVFSAYRTLNNGDEKYEYIGDFKVQDGGYIYYDAPFESVTTFLGKK